MRAQVNNVQHVHRIAARDASEYIVKAYQCGNFTKAVELAEFQKQRMESSLQLATVRADMSNLQLLMSKHTAAGEWKRLR